MEDYRLPGPRGLPSARKRDNGIQPGPKDCELVDCDGLPPLHHCQHTCILSHVMCVGHENPKSGLKECGELGMHTHLPSAMFLVTFVSPYFVVGNAVGAVV